MRKQPQSANLPAHQLGRPKPGAFTLIEMLCALALTTILVTLTGPLLVNALKARQQAQRMVAQMERRASIFEHIAEDVERLLPPIAGDQPSLMLFGFPRQVLQLSVLTAVDFDEAALHAVQHPATVRYRWVDSPYADEDGRLIRETIDLTQYGAAPIRETIGKNIADFKLEVLLDHRWTNRFPRDDPPQGYPRALRVTIEWNDAHDQGTRTFVLPNAS